MFFIFTPYLGKIPVLTNICQNGLKPPTSKMMSPVSSCRGFFFNFEEFGDLERFPYQIYPGLFNNGVVADLQSQVFLLVKFNIMILLMVQTSWRENPPGMNQKPFKWWDNHSINWLVREDFWTISMTSSLRHVLGEDIANLFVGSPA